MQDVSRLADAFQLFDQANSQDPNRESFEGHEYPKELLYARRMTQWMDRFAPDASAPLRLAARSQHLERWTRPRADYPMDRVGYLRWRTDLKKFHADRAGEMLRSVGYDEETIERVGSLLRKEGLKSDPEMQTLEDVICLVFLESYFDDFAGQHDEEKIVNILQKTWGKMSEEGHAAALGLNLSPEALRLVTKALGG